jgi:hypothetical protein
VAEKSRRDWTPYRIGRWSREGSVDCQDLDIVSHVTHVNAALTILRDGALRPRLIYDESRLNTERILVTWLSPNDWTNAGGFRYGNIAFDLDWSDITDGRRFYWVGVMQYRPVACRILLTEEDRENELEPYDPSLRDGPWWRSARTARDYWNGEYCIEFMLEAEVPIADVTGLRFVKHHATRCSINYRTCPDCGHEAGRAAARVLAGACHRRLLAPTSSLWLEGGTPGDALTFAWQELRGRIASSPQIRWRGPVRAGSGRGAAVARAAMGTYCEMARDDRVQLLSLFLSQDDAIEAFASVIEDDLSLEADTLARDEEDD